MKHEKTELVVRPAAEPHRAAELTRPSAEAAWLSELGGGGYCGVMTGDCWMDYCWWMKKRKGS